MKIVTMIKICAKTRVVFYLGYDLYFLKREFRQVDEKSVQSKKLTLFYEE